MPADPADILARLREATADRHHRLDTALDLLGPTPTRQRVVNLIAAFYGFHHIWEPAILRVPECRDLAASRSRLPLLRDDLRTLGLSSQQIVSLPCCSAAAALARNWPVALGSIYVMEGSTLGGQLITRALPFELRSFNPYGQRTGMMWQEFRAAIRQRVDGESTELTLLGACETFDLLLDWLRPAF